MNAEDLYKKISEAETEYEKKFKSKGVRINYLDAIKKNKKNS